MIFDPRFDYGRAAHKIEKKKDGVLFISEGDDQLKLFLRTSLPLKEENRNSIIVRDTL